MKLIFSLIVFMAALANAQAANESGPGNGTDYVKILFAEAREELLADLASVHAADIQAMNLDQDVKAWLLGNWAAPAAGALSNGASARIEALKPYLQNFDLQFQSAPCPDSNERGSTICFKYEDGRPVVLVSLEQNRLTTSSQAMAMLIHECGHFLGEMDHLFLDRVGVELTFEMSPRLLIVTRSLKEPVADLFTAKSSCEDGSSVQAKQLLKLASMDLHQRCVEHRLQCDLSKANSVFTGESEWINGQGFTMNTICTVRMTLDF